MTHQLRSKSTVTQTRTSHSRVTFAGHVSDIVSPNILNMSQRHASRMMGQHHTPRIKTASRPLHHVLHVTLWSNIHNATCPLPHYIGLPPGRPLQHLCFSTDAQMLL